jgi:hypothetical protein
MIGLLLGLEYDFAIAVSQLDGEVNVDVYVGQFLQLAPVLDGVLNHRGIDKVTYRAAFVDVKGTEVPLSVVLHISEE